MDFLKQKLQQGIGDVGHFVGTIGADVSHLFGGGQQAPQAPTAAPQVHVAPLPQQQSLQVQGQVNQPAPLQVAPQHQQPMLAPPPTQPVAAPVVAGVKTVADTNAAINNPLRIAPQQIAKGQNLQVPTPSSIGTSLNPGFWQQAAAAAAHAPAAPPKPPGEQFTDWLQSQGHIPIVGPILSTVGQNVADVTNAVNTKGVGAGTAEFAKDITGAGIQNSPVGAGARLFGGLAEQVAPNQHGMQGAQFLTGTPAASFSQQVKTMGLPMTVFANVSDVLGAGDTAVEPAVKTVAGNISDALHSERGSIEPPMGQPEPGVPEEAPQTPPAAPGTPQRVQLGETTTEAPGVTSVTSAQPENPYRPGSRDLQGETSAMNVLQNGGDMQTAIEAYREQYGGEGRQAGAKPAYADAARAVDQMAKEAGIDVSGYNPTDNPQFEHIQLPDVAPGDYRGAVLNQQGIQKTMDDLLERVNQTAKGMSGKDVSLLDYLRDDTPDTLAPHADNPDQFRAVAEAAKDLTDYQQEANRLSGMDVPYRPQYGARLFYDTSTPELQQALEAYRASLVHKPGYGQARTTLNYDDGAQFGAKRKYANFLEDLAHDVSERRSEVGQNVLAHGLEQAYPGKTMIGEIGRVPTEGTFKQLQIPGGSAISLPKDIADEINARAPYEYAHGLTGTAAKVYDQANSDIKFLSLALGGFHSGVEATAFLAERISRGDLGSFGRMISATVSKSAFDGEMERMGRMGTLDRANIAGLTRGRIAADAEIGPVVGRGRFNPIRALHSSLFEREIPYAKLRTFETMTEGHNDLAKPEDVAYMRQTALALNDAYGGINRAVQGIGSRNAKQLSRITLALDYNEGQIRSLRTALTQGGPAGAVARRVVLGKMVLLAIPGAVMYSMQPGAHDNPRTLVTRVLGQLVNPHTPSNFKTPGGIPKVVNLPTNPLGKVARAISPIFDKNQPDKLSGIGHELTGNLSSLPSLGIQLKRNQDYYGNPIVTKSPVQTAINIGSSVSPIAVNQAQRVINGTTSPTTGVTTKESPMEALINTLGGRTSADPDNPRMVMLNYRQQAISKLDPETQGVLYQIHPTWNPNATKQQIDQTYANPNYELAKYAALLQNPKALAAEQQIDAFNQSQGMPADPFFKLSGQQQQTLMRYEELNKSSPGFESTATDMLDKNPWMNGYFNEQSHYQTQLNTIYTQTGGTSGEPAPQVGAVPYPNVSPQMQSLANQYYGLGNSTQRSQFLQQNPQLNNYFNTMADYTNAVRQSLGEPQLKPYPNAPDALNAFMNQYSLADPATKAQLKADNPGMFSQMTSYLDQVSEYQLAKNAGQDMFVGNTPNQEELKSAYDLGKYAITKNPDGTFSFQPGGSGTGGSSGSKKSPLVPLPPRPKVRKSHPKRPPKVRKAYVKKAHLKTGSAPKLAKNKQGGITVKA